jgi:hypothetical protein
MAGSLADFHRAVRRTFVASGEFLTEAEHAAAAGEAGGPVATMKLELSQAKWQVPACTTHPPTHPPTDRPTHPPTHPPPHPRASLPL